MSNDTLITEVDGLSMMVGHEIDPKYFHEIIRVCNYASDKDWETCTTRGQTEKYRITYGIHTWKPAILFRGENIEHSGYSQL